MDINGISDDYKTNNNIVCNDLSKVCIFYSDQGNINLIHVNITRIYQIKINIVLSPKI